MPVVFTADICKMYTHIEIHPDDHNYVVSIVPLPSVELHPVAPAAWSSSVPSSITSIVERLVCRLCSYWGQLCRGGNTIER
ncbi:hypothetical protein PR048_026499 [Dryococelus australis]|uniref:Uncharacterized protein n=1 Tax=Dryococelus australis TaxID=614101 RepID=A0ABQ9GLI0_9NEOP|nr:hypothetical protein PR048_026499 [Dryococelus australis]